MKFSKYWLLPSLALFSLIGFLGWYLQREFHSVKAQFLADAENQLALSYTEVRDQEVLRTIKVFTDSTHQDSSLFALLRPLTGMFSTDSLDAIEINRFEYFGKKSDSLNIATEDSIFFSIDVQKKSDSTQVILGSHVAQWEETTTGIKLSNKPVLQGINNRSNFFSQNNEAVFDNFKNKFEEQEKGIDMDLVEKKVTLNGPYIEYDPKGFGDSILVRFNHLGWAITKMILPNILFASLLLLMVLLALVGLLRSRYEQQQNLKFKNEFVSNMTHELKTPISTVKLALEAIDEFSNSEQNGLDRKDKISEYAKISRKEMNRLSSLVDKVLQISMFDNERKEKKRTKIKMDELIAEQIELLNNAPRDKPVHINFSHNGSDSFCQGEEVHLTNVIHNLVDNAIKYSDNEVKINISLTQDESNLLLQVQDNGHGIPVEYQHKIFQRFFRIPTEDRHDVKGHGLGLAYVKQVIEEHGGKISLESKMGKGSIFYISLPKMKS